MMVQGCMSRGNYRSGSEILYMNSMCAGKKGCISVKLDMSKAYDRVEWEFIKNVMLKVGFATSWVELVMMCVSTLSHVVVVNGEPSEFFFPERGLRQGDPVSLYLFILCAEVFSNLIHMEVNRKCMQGIRVCKNAPKISHLLFADDGIIFYRADEKDAQAIRRILQCYGNASGQIVNFG